LLAVVPFCQTTTVGLTAKILENHEGTPAWNECAPRCQADFKRVQQ
jgi:hypothetical protein